jgi:hypothetical protein
MGLPPELVGRVFNKYQSKLDRHLAEQYRVRKETRAAARAAMMAQAPGGQLLQPAAVLAPGPGASAEPGAPAGYVGAAPLPPGAPSGLSREVSAVDAGRPSLSTEDETSLGGGGPDGVALRVGRYLSHASVASLTATGASMPPSPVTPAFDIAAGRVAAQTAAPGVRGS